MSAQLEVTRSFDHTLRRCALTLHAMAPSDRDWVLARLTGPRSEDLRALLDELSVLGVAPDAGLAAAALGVEPGIPAGRAPREDHGRLAQVLQAEPAILVAHVLGTRTQKAGSVLGALDKSRRDAVEAQMSRRLAVPHALAAAIDEELDRAVADVRASTKPPTRQRLAIQLRRGWRKLRVGLQ